MQPKVTIFTQAYNTEEYIEKCIESVLSQTFSDFEHIIVDNGSTDKTKDIIAQYAKKDTRIKVSRFEENRRGFWPDFVKEHATGEYFSSLDSDDWLEPTFLEVLIGMADRETLDVAICGTYFHLIETKGIALRKSDAQIIIDKQSVPQYFKLSYQFFRTVWGKIYRMSVVKNTNYSDFYSIAKTGYGGDTAFCLDALEFTNRIGISDKILHNYLVRPKSTSHEYNPKRSYSDIFLLRKAEIYLSQFGQISQENYQYIYLVYISAIMDTIKIILKSTLEPSKKFLEIEKILSIQVTQKALKIIPDYDEAKAFKATISELLVNFSKVNPGNENVLNFVLVNLCLLNPNISQYINNNNLLEHISNTKFLLSSINLNAKDMLKEAISLLNNEQLSNNLWESIKKLFEKYELLSWINDKAFVIKYDQIIIDIYASDFFTAMDKIINLLVAEEEIPFSEELITLCLKLSNAINDNEAFIYAKKLQTNLYIEQKRFNEAETALSDLFKICHNDNEVLELKKYLEESYA